MQPTRYLAIPVLAALTLFISALPGHAAPTFYVAETMHLPPAQNSLESFDISFVDPQTQTYIFADRSNSGISVWDAESKLFLRNTGQFAGAKSNTACGTGISGPNGVLVIDPRRDDDRHSDPDQWQGRENHDTDRDDVLQGWGGDGDSTVKVVNLNNGDLLVCRHVSRCA